MPKALDPEAAHDLVRRAVTALAGDEAAKKVSPLIDAAFELARQTAITGSRGKHEPVITSVKVSVHGGLDREDGEPVTAVFDKRPVIAHGPNKGVPIRTGGGKTCFSATVGKLTVTICLEWAS